MSKISEFKRYYSPKHNQDNSVSLKTFKHASNLIGDMRETNGKQNVWIEQKSRRNEQKIVAQLSSWIFVQVFHFSEGCNT